MTDMISDVADFSRATGQHMADEPGFPPKEVERLRYDLIEEESMEVRKALTLDQIPDIAKEICDLIYVAIGTANAYGIPLAAVWDEVQRSNMSKIGPDGSVVRDESGKVLKGPHYQPPDVAGVIERHIKWRKDFARLEALREAQEPDLSAGNAAL